MKRFSLLLILLLICFCHSCNNEETCTSEDLTSRVVAKFYVRDASGERDTIMNGVTFYGTLRPDSLIYESHLGLRSFEFPLPGEPEEHTDFILQVENNADTIKIWHTPKLALVSWDCGFTTAHEIFWLSHDSTLIDTISIHNSYVNLADEVNLKIYIRPVAAVASR